MPIESDASLRTFLRSATSAAHARLDAASSVFDLRLRPSYGRFLATQAAALLPLELVLERQSGAVISDWPVRRRTGAILADLDRLRTPVPPPVPLVSGDSPAWTLGALYVLEGSRLGGAVLRRRVLEGDDADCRAATAYLGHGAAQRLWPSFLAQLETAAAHGDRPGLVAGAIAAFTAFERAAGLPDLI